MQFTLASALQILILTVGIYLVLGFLRTTRGGGLLRGLVVAILVVVAGLAGLAKHLELAELSHIIESFTGFAVVILAILFQPELRRGLSHLGENPLVGRFLRTRRGEVVTEVTQAAITMANKRQGALIAFERKNALDAFIEGGVKIDAEVNRFLIDSLFHHGSALHDGAVIVRGDRIAAATSLFPLTENIEISKSTGTRHRAALGLTEETDAVTIAVSEETGAISICKGGEIIRRVAPAELEARLREMLGSEEGERGTDEQPNGFGRWVSRLFTVRLGQKAGALALAAGIFWIAYQDIRETNDYALEVVISNSGQQMPTPGYLTIVLTDEDYNLVEPKVGSEVQVEITGTRAELEPLGAELGGVLFVKPEMLIGPRDFPLADVQWGAGRFAKDLEARWTTQPAPQLEIGRLGRTSVELTLEHVPIDDTDLSPRYRVATEGIEITPTSVTVMGPATTIDAIDNETIPFRLSSVRLGPGDTKSHTALLRLSPSLLDQRCRLLGREHVEVSIPIVPEEQDLGMIEKEITLINVPGPGGVDAWEPPSQTANFSILTAGLLDADPGSPGWIEQSAAVIRFIDDNLQVYVNVGEIEEASGPRARIRYYLQKDWREELLLESAVGDLTSSLSVRLEGEPELLLIPKSTSESGGGPSNGDLGSGDQR